MFKKLNISIGNANFPYPFYKYFSILIKLKIYDISLKTVKQIN